ncbi:MAG: hypothetical protein ACREVY_15635 [Gammaproteobacteria bacterium]
MEAAKTMITNAKYQDTPSIVHDDITTVISGRTLKYADLSGREKRDYLFDQGIRATAYANYKDETRPDVVSGLVQFSKSALQSIKNHLLSESLTRVSDELENPKPKLFHTYGATAKVVFVPEPGTPYTGILSEPVPGLARFSYAGPVIGIGVVPGLGLKVLMDGDHPSENLVAMRQLDRQQPAWRFFSTRSHNSVFQNPFTNILPVPRFTNLVMRTVNKRFETVVAVGKGLHQPLDNFAKVRANGDPVAGAKVVSPYRVIFRPTPQAIAASDATLDFRDDLAHNIKTGTTIYDVFALDETQEMELNGKGVMRVEKLLAHARKIGTITTESEFIASKYGDYRLFFKHNARYLRNEFRK